mmetsp:Transcript_4199/g.11439  ORF Transcript_4199/g.11439 Transcript_4199/m.11439 type:complete len:239 (-) Transcript_4199:153-869(-)
MISMKLFAGISSTFSITNPCTSPNDSTSPMSRYPHSLFRPRRVSSKVALPSDVCSPFRLNGPYIINTPHEPSSSLDAPTIVPTVADQGDMWVMLITRTPTGISHDPANPSGHDASLASNTAGSSTFSTSLQWCLMDSNDSSVRSVGSHVSCGKSGAMCAACCPVPHASSTNRPPFSPFSVGTTTSAMGWRLRSAAALLATLLKVSPFLSQEFSLAFLAGGGSGPWEAIETIGRRVSQM